LFWPGACFPPGFVQVILVAIPVTLTVILRSWLPIPASLPVAVSVVPLSVKVGPLTKWMFAAQEIALHYVLGLRAPSWRMEPASLGNGPR
jgi:hypothetical protein